ncbi:hypothetical protein L6452_40505 [Arctium lappa]|uniref:Uncharacterized protein n=1 Tax=Arctium lappa TaxID=4217 RepID=A0ACB8XM34_ARCLA|nr:hypothetical protein L6452_40505 [Arctium lappa]
MLVPKDTLRVSFIDCLRESDFGRHAFGRIMNSVVDKVVVRIVAEVTTRLVFVQQLRLPFSYEHLLTRNLSSGITFDCLHQKLSAILNILTESKTKLLNKDKSTSDLMRISVKQRRIYLYAKEHEEKLQR